MTIPAGLLEMLQRRMGGNPQPNPNAMSLPQLPGAMPAPGPAGVLPPPGGVAPQPNPNAMAAQQTPQVNAAGGIAPDRLAMAPSQTPQVNAPPGLMDRISAWMAKPENREFLLGAGQSLLAQSGPSPVAQPLMGSIANAIMAGKARVGAGQQEQLRAQMQKYELEHAARQSDLAKKRTELFNRYPASPSDTRETVLKRMESMLPELAAMGDVPTMTEFVKYLSSHAAQPFDPKFVPAGGHTVVYDTRTGTAVGVIPHTAPPTDPNAAAAQSFNEMDKVVDNFRRDTDKSADAVRAYQNVLAGLKDITNPYAGIDILKSFLRLANPGAVVRMNDMKSVREAGNIPMRFESQLSQMMSGHMSPELLGYLAEQSHNMAREHRKGYERYRKNALNLGRAGRLNMRELDSALPNEWAEVGIPEEGNANAVHQTLTTPRGPVTGGGAFGGHP